MTERPAPGPAALRLRVAIVEDDAVTRRLVRAWLEPEGYEVVELRTGRQAVDAGGEGFAAMCLDLGLEDMDGLDVLRHVHANCPEVSVLVATSETSHDAIIGAMRAGAHDYVIKPLDRQRFVTSVRAAVETSALRRKVMTLHKELEGSRGQRAIVGTSRAVKTLMTSIERVLGSEVVVCIVGESGSGKELVARALHDEGRRKIGPFVALNCAAIPENLQEAELFGHEKGAFTGAAGLYRGRFEQAEGGTLFLDEVGDMSAATQVKLLRALQEKTVRRIGGSVDIQTNVRVVCATHRNLEAEVAAGRFREDLYFRIMVYPIEVPPLRERADDIPLLVAHFTRAFRDDVGRDISRVSPEAIEAMMAYRWPGNVRELQNVVHRAMLSCSTSQIELSDLPPALRGTKLPPLPPGESSPAKAHASAPAGTLPTLSLAALEKMAMAEAVRTSAGNIGKAAKLLGIGRSTLYRRLLELGMESPPGEEEP